MSYEKFAFLYDELMSDAPYDEWVSFVVETLEAYKIEERDLLDVGCGTGNICIPLSKLGFTVTAVDLSEEMLMVAKQKSERAATSVEFFHQDMRELQGLGLFTTVISFCDSINYLDNEKEVQITFENIYAHLKKDGMFIFDVHSIEKVVNFFTENTFAYNGEDVSYIWECFKGEAPNSVEHDLSFFVRNSNGLYERFDELHQQRTYSVEFYKEMLENTGFQVLAITSDFSRQKLDDADGQRIFFIAKK